jgi:hypothetical protein
LVENVSQRKLNAGSAVCYLKGTVEVNAPPPETTLLGPNDVAVAPFNKFIAVGLALRMLLARARILPAPSA